MAGIKRKAAAAAAKSFIIAALFLQFLPAWAQSHSQTLIGREGAGAYKTIERSDWSRYDNGRYIGHVYRETRATINPVETGQNALLYRGNFFVLEETLRDMRQSARAVNDVVPVSFRILPSGDLSVEDDRGFPALRGFPVFPSDPVYPGSKWTARGMRMADPLNEGFPVAVPITAEYEYNGIELYQNMPVHRISARYASRYQGGAAARGARVFTALQGTHQVDILLRVSDGLPLLMRDNMDETYTWADGSTLRFRGFTLTFGEGIVPLNADSVITSLRHSMSPVLQGGRGVSGGSVPRAVPEARDAPAAPPPAPLLDDEWEKQANIELAAVPGGVKLTVKDIRFAPDSDEFLASEYPRLDMIAEALRRIPDRTFLVEGHTAAVGLPQGEMELSIQRSKRMVDELVKRGIGADRFLYKGWGGTRPIGDNSTDPGRALNRRVEITILE